MFTCWIELLIQIIEIIGVFRFDIVWIPTGLKVQTRIIWSWITCVILDVDNIFEDKRSGSEVHQHAYSNRFFPFLLAQKLDHKLDILYSFVAII